MWTQLLREHLYLLQMAALVVGAGILILNAARDVFELKPDHRTINPPIDSPGVPATDFRYMSDHAEDARDELRDLADAMRCVLIPFAIAIILSFGLVIVFKFIDGFGSPEWQSSVCNPGQYRPFLCASSRTARLAFDWWASVNFAEVLLGFMSAVVIVLGSYIILKLASIVHHVIQARTHYAEHGPV